MKELVHKDRWIAELIGVDPNLINNPEGLFRAGENLANFMGLNIVGRIDYRWIPQGHTGGLILAESHLIWHNWPERDRQMSLDLYSCSPSLDLSEFPEAVLRFYPAEQAGFLKVPVPLLRPARLSERFRVLKEG